jgi:phosphodiesterase/alkaline phosphatase D-like protein
MMRSWFLLCLLVALAYPPRVRAKLPLAMHAEIESAPFVLGVASGEPTETSVVLWTRVQHEGGGQVFTSDQSVFWRLWNPSNGSFVLNGTLLALASDDFTVIADVTALESNTYYFYQFTHVASGNTSSIGRTRTAPSALDMTADSTIRIATMSCGSIWSGFLHSYDRIADQEDLAIVLHLGDYIYPDLDPSACERVPLGLDPACIRECRGAEASAQDSANVSQLVAEYSCAASELERFRWVHRYYLHDPMLRRMRQRHPLVAIFDNHDLGSPRTANRTSSGAIRAFLDFLPSRARLATDVDDVFYRDYVFGDMLHVLALDSRALGRSNESTGLFDSQQTWARSALSNQSDIPWRVVMSTTAFAPWAVNGWDAFVYSVLAGVLTGFVVLALSCCGLLYCLRRRHVKTIEGNDELTQPALADVDSKPRRLSPQNKDKLLKCCICYGSFNIVVVIVLWIVIAVVVARVVSSRGLSVQASGNSLALVAAQDRNWDGNPELRRQFLDVFRKENLTKDNIWLSGDL